MVAAPFTSNKTKHEILLALFGCFAECEKTRKQQVAWLKQNQAVSFGFRIRTVRLTLPPSTISFCKSVDAMISIRMAYEAGEDNKTPNKYFGFKSSNERRECCSIFTFIRSVQLKRILQWKEIHSDFELVAPFLQLTTVTESMRGRHRMHFVVVLCVITGLKDNLHPQSALNRWVIL